jgi:hypothetical protein
MATYVRNVDEKLNIKRKQIKNNNYFLKYFLLKNILK